MDQIIIAGFLLFIILCFVILFNEKNKFRKLRTEIKAQFGTKPVKSDYDKKDIEYFWSEFEALVPKDEKIDNITWNDLEMDYIYDRINNCKSFVGEQVLYYTLHCLPKENGVRELLEKKISFFSNNEKERVEIQLLLCGLGKKYGSYHLPLFINNLDVFEIPNIRIYRIMQILLFLPILPFIVLHNPAYLFITGIIFFINFLIYSIKNAKYSININMLNNVISLVDTGIKITNTKKYTYENQFHDLKDNTVLFSKLSHSISKIQRKKEASLSGDVLGMIYDYLIGATLWDFIKYDHIIRTLKGKQDKFIEFYKKIGELDMAISIASFRASLAFYCTPSFQDKQHDLQMEDMYHPLIDLPVSNTVTLNKSCIITGSNASGKSTFIKALSINAILAQSINTCMAKQMSLPYSLIITSMAVRDDLMAGESYYIKEIKYLNRIIQNLSEERFVICSIDEILRGTNTEERIAASSAILKFLCKRNCIAIVASHDVKLTQILKDLYGTYHFREQIRENDIFFDYKIHAGVTNSKNAIKLLEYVGFPSEIIEDAKKPLLTIK